MIFGNWGRGFVHTWLCDLGMDPPPPGFFGERMHGDLWAWY